MVELRLVLIRYYDHVEFRNRDCSQLKPLLREVAGWIAYEDAEKLILLVEISNSESSASKMESSTHLTEKTDDRDPPTIYDERVEEVMDYSQSSELQNISQEHKERKEEKQALYELLEVENE